MADKTVRIYLVSHCVDGVWDDDGEWFFNEDSAKDHAQDVEDADNGHVTMVMAVDVPKRAAPMPKRSTL